MLRLPYKFLIKVGSSVLMKCVVVIFQIVNQNARTGVQRHRIRSRVCFSARNAVQSVCVFLLVPMAISKVALATITGRPKEVAQSAHDHPYCIKM